MNKKDKSLIERITESVHTCYREDTYKKMNDKGEIYCTYFDIGYVKCPVVCPNLLIDNKPIIVEKKVGHFSHKLEYYKCSNYYKLPKN